MSGPPIADWDVGDTARPPAPAGRELTLSAAMLAAFPLALLAGFILAAGALSNYTMDKTLAISPLNVGIAIVGLVIASAPPIVGMAYAVRAVRMGRRAAWIALFLNALVCALVAVMTIGSVGQVMSGR